MNEIEKEKLVQKLISETRITEEKIITYKELCKPIPPENSIGRVSRMDAINNKSVVEAALREAERSLEQLKLMQKRTKEKDFGLCLKCRKEIPFGRLIIQPSSKFCVNCAK